MKSLIRRDADVLFRGINPGKERVDNKGLWDYLGKGDRIDHSVSQYGVLGLWACQQTGAVDVGAGSLEVDRGRLAARRASRRRAGTTAS